MKKILTLICTLLCANVLMAQDFFLAGQLYYFVTSDSTVKVNAYNSSNPPTNLVIPETVTYQGTTFNVTEIGEQAFRYYYNGTWVVSTCTTLTSVVIPNSVTSIGDGAFYNCSSLTSIDIPNSVTYIGNQAFEDCSSLTSVTLPENATISYDAFDYVGTDVIIDSVTYSRPSAYLYIGSKMFYVGFTTFYLGDNVYRNPVVDASVSDCYTSKSGEVVIPSSFEIINMEYPVTSIKYSAFKNCSSLTSVVIPNSVTSIGYQAFDGCSSLTSITIPNSVTSIGEYAFDDCSSLTSITIPNSVTSIGEYAFRYCSSLTSMTIDMNNIPNLNNIGLNSSLQNLTLGENVTSIASGAFNNYSFLQNVTCLATTPPTIADNTVFPYPNIATLTVPCGTLEAYSSPTSFWNTFFMGRISEDGYEVVATANNDAFGSVAIENNCSTATLTATANACYQFVGWNDGNTENPRLVTLSSDTTLTANFEEIVFDTTITATINAGEMYSEFGFNESEAGTYVQNLQTVNGCDSTITLILDVNSSLIDIEETEITFYPNPTNSKITFSSTIEKVEVIDLTGKAILTFSNAKAINIEALPSGAYYLRLTNNDKAIMRKVIKE